MTLRFWVAALVVGFGALSALAADVRRTERGNLVLENIPDTPASVRERLRLYQAVRGAVFLDFSPDGRRIVYADGVLGPANGLFVIELDKRVTRRLTHDSAVRSMSSAS